MVKFMAQSKFISFLLFSLLLFACTNQSSELRDLKQDKLIEVYFNNRENSGKTYIDPYRKIERQGDNLEKIIVDSINSAQSSIDLAVQELNLPLIAQALAESHKKGIGVRVILDNNYSHSLSELTATEVARLNNRDRQHYNRFFQLLDSDNNGNLSKKEIATRDALIILRNTGVPLVDDTEDGSKGSGLMHHKFIIIDRQIVITGSANFTLSGIHGDFANPETRGNTNNLVRLDSSQLANIFTEEFNYMWGDGVDGSTDSLFGLAKPIRSPAKITLGTTTIQVHFSPTSPTQSWSKSSNGLIGQNLSQSKQSIDLALFVFSEQKLVDILAEKQEQGVTIQGVFEPEFATRYYSEVLDMLGVAQSDRCKYETGNNPWSTPINTVGIAQLPQGDKMHHKFAVIDGQTVITGSHNWSAAANEDNDENVLIIDNPTVAAHFLQEFDLLYTQAQLGMPQYLQGKLDRQKQKCS
jgi:phosphatidylserine/phosphatidylglycerophosphate/cardiolipin synthase-like enzyme